MNTETPSAPKPLIGIIDPSFSKTYNNVVVQGGLFVHKNEVSRLGRVLEVNTKTEEPVEITMLVEPPDFAEGRSNLALVVLRREGGAVAGCSRELDSSEIEEKWAARNGTLKK